MAKHLLSFATKHLICVSKRSYTTNNVQKCLQELSDISITPNNPSYQFVTKLYNPAFSYEHPAFVALPNSVADIQRCLQTASRNRVPVALRSGGHCFAGYSTIDSQGFVLSLDKMESVEWSDFSVKIQAGVMWREVYDNMPVNQLVVGGCCPSVGVGGYVLGGGYGLLSRRFGLGSDNALKMTMVTADGERVVSAGPNENEELFWGLCGGGGGNFGVLVDATFKVHPAPPNFTWSASSFHSAETSEAAMVLVGKYLHSMPDGLNVDLLIHKLPGYNQLCVDVVYSDPEIEQFPLIQELSKLTESETVTYSLYKDLSNNYAKRHGYVHFEGSPVYMKGSFINDFPPQLAEELTRIELPQDPLGLIEFVHVGGNISSKSSDYSAYLHRNAQYNCYTYGRFLNDSERTTVFEFANTVHSMLVKEGYAKGSYVNYMDRFLDNWADEYYGDNYARLCELKSNWNPIKNGGPLHFLQEIGSSYKS